jgi:Zn-dependent dipeptidase, microsomal dipeptidase homolog
MRYFDLHCDTITECFLKNEPLDENDLAVSVKGAEVFDVWAQIFAVWMPDDIRGQTAWRRFLDVAGTLRRQTEENGIPLCTGAGALENAVQSGAKRAAILSIEGSAALGGRIENLKTAYALGVRLVTLTWNGGCEAGGGCLDGGGLTPFGFALVREMEELGIIADVSHLSEKGFADLAHASGAPFVATHSDARAVCGNKRNLTDDQFREIVRRGGVVGLNLYPPFMGSDSIRAILPHIDHFLSLGGENTLAVGADFDGARMPKEIAGIADMAKFHALLQRNYGETVAEKIFFCNAYNFFKTLLTKPRRME